MARPKKNVEAARDLGERLTALRTQQQPDKSNDQIARELEFHHGVVIREEHCRMFHSGDVDPTSCKVEELRGWTLYYDVPPTALGFIAAQRLRMAFALFGGTGDDDHTPSEQDVPSSRCIVQLAA